MEEEKKEMPEIESNEMQTNVQDIVVNQTVDENNNQNNVQNNNVEKTPKKHTGLIIAALVLFVLALAFYIIYDKFYKKDDKPKENSTEEKSTPIPPTPGIDNEEENEENNENIEEIEDDEEDYNAKYDIPILETDSNEIKIVKEKLKMAFNFFDSSCFMVEKELYSEEGNGSMFCYFDTVDNFKNKFYSIYSNQLDYKDVYAEYRPPLDYNDYSTNVENGDLIYGFAIKDNKVYHNSCTIGSNDYKRMDKFVIESATDDKIVVNYKVIYQDQLAGGDEYENGDAKITLVKENDDWKILNATIVNMCNGTYKIGK